MKKLFELYCYLQSQNISEEELAFFLTNWKNGRVPVLHPYLYDDGREAEWIEMNSLPVGVRFEALGAFYVRLQMSSIPINYEQAVKYCDALHYAGRKWRLPQDDEFKEIGHNLTWLNKVNQVFSKPPIWGRNSPPCLVRELECWCVRGHGDATTACFADLLSPEHSFVANRLAKNYVLAVSSIE